MQFKIVLGVDPGLINCGVSRWRVFENGTRQMLNAERISFLQNKAGTLHYEYKQMYLPQLVSLAIKERDYLFQGVDLAVIECQMSRKMICIAQSIEHALIARNSVVVNLPPRTLKVHFGISMSDYRRNKVAAVQYCNKHLTTSQLHRMQKACVGGKVSFPLFYFIVAIKLKF